MELSVIVHQRDTGILLRINTVSQIMEPDASQASLPVRMAAVSVPSGNVTMTTTVEMAAMSWNEFVVQCSLELLFRISTFLLSPNHC